MNNKGFMMAEVVIVSSIVLIFLTTIFTSFNKMYATYLTRVGYYDVVTLYRLGYYRDILIENGQMSRILTDDSVTKIYGIDGVNNLFNLPPAELSNNQEDTVFLIRTATDNHAISASSLNNSQGVSETFKDYIKYLSTSVMPKSNYIMVMERCNIEDNTVNTDYCKYAYLEIYDGKE